MSASATAFEFARNLLGRVINRRSTRKPIVRPIYEPLENRMLLSAVTVTGTMDIVDGDTSSLAALIATPGSDNEISLREATQAANNTQGEDVIDFSSILSGLTLELDSGLTVTDTLTINGLGQDQLTLSADGIFAFFNVDMTNNPDDTFTLTNVTLQGHADYAIYANPGNVILDNVTLQGDGDVANNFKINSTTLELNSKTTVKNAGLEIQTSGDVFLDNMELDGSLSITSDAGSINVSGNIITSNGGGIFLNSAVTLFSDVTINASSNIYFQDTVDFVGTGSGDLTLFADSISISAGESNLDAGDSTSSGNASMGGGGSISMGGSYPISGGGITLGETIPYGGGSTGGGVTLGSSDGSTMNTISASLVQIISMNKAPVLAHDFATPSSTFNPLTTSILQPINQGLFSSLQRLLTLDDERESRLELLLVDESA